MILSEFFALAGFLYIGMLWIASGVVCLWICRRIETAAATRLLTPVLLVLASCSALVFCTYAMEVFVAYYSDAQYEWEAMSFRWKGPFAWAYMTSVALHLVPVAFFWSKVRSSMRIACWLILPLGFVNAIMNFVATRS